MNLSPAEIASNSIAATALVVSIAAFVHTIRRDRRAEARLVPKASASVRYELGTFGESIPWLVVANVGSVPLCVERIAFSESSGVEIPGFKPFCLSPGECREFSLCDCDFRGDPLVILAK